MAIKRTVTEALFSVNLNVIMAGSKKLSQEQQEKLLQVDRVRVVISDARDPDNVLLDTEAGAIEFSSGNVGFSVQARGRQFSDELTG